MGNSVEGGKLNQVRRSMFGHGTDPVATTTSRIQFPWPVSLAWIIRKFVSTYIVRQLHWTIVHCETAVGAAAAAPRTGPRSGRSLRRVQPNSASPPWWSCPFGRSGPESSSAFAADAPRLRNISDIPFGLPCFASRWWLLLLAGNCKSQIKRTGVITGWLVGGHGGGCVLVGWLVIEKKEKREKEPGNE